jgi:hypothetical protein
MQNFAFKYVSCSKKKKDGIAFPTKNLTTFYHPVKSAPYFYHANQFKLRKKKKKKKRKWEAIFFRKEKKKKKNLSKVMGGKKPSILLN